MTENLTTQRSEILTRIGVFIVALSACMKVLLPSLDIETGSHMLANQGIFAGLFFFLLGLILAKKGIAPSLAMVLFCAFALFEMTRGFFSVTAPAVERGMEVFAGIAVMLVVSYCARQSESSLRTVLGIFAGMAVTVAVIAAGQDFLSLPELRANADAIIADLPEGDRAEFLDRLMTREAFGPFTISNALAAFSMLFAFGFLGLAIRAIRKKSDWIIPSAVSLLCFIALFLSRSKGGFLAAGFAFAVGSYLLMRLKGISTRKALIIPLVACCIGIIAIVVLVMFAPPQYGKASADVRLGYWEASAKLFTSSHIVGTGSGTFRDIYYSVKDPTAGETKHAHCDYLEIAVESGVIGLALFMAALFALLWKNRKPDAVMQIGATDKGRFSFLFAPAVVWFGIGLSIVICGACDFENLIVHARDGSPLWVMLLLATLFAGPIAAYAVSRRINLSAESQMYISAGLTAGAAGFCAHCLIDFNLYNEGAALAFFAVCGLLAPTESTARKAWIVIPLVFALIFSFVSSELSKGRDTRSRLNGIISRIDNEDTKLDESTLKSLVGDLAVTPPALLDSAESYATRGELCERLGAKYAPFFDLAVGHYRTAVELNPHNFSYHRLLGLALLKTGEVENGLKALNEAHLRYPSNAKFLVEYINALLDAGKFDESRAMRKKLDTLLALNLPNRAKPEIGVIQKLEERMK